MRYTKFIHITFCFSLVLLTHISLAQNVLNKRISVSIKKLSYSQALEKIGEIAGADFYYSSDYLPKKKVSLEVQDSTLRFVLDELFKGINPTYEVAGTEITFRFDPVAINRGPFTISGRIVEAATGEPLRFVHIVEKNTNHGTTTNEFGHYSISLPKGTYIFEFSYIGLYKVIDTIKLQQDTYHHVELIEEASILPALDFSASTPSKNSDNRIPEPINLVTPKLMKIAPSQFGEKEPMRYVIDNIPGILTGSEGGTTMFVRGGGADQNLILLDGAPVYNSGHLLNYFSIFNPETIKEIEIYKGGIPARYGGRLSSVLDIRTKEGNKKERVISGGIGNLSGRLTVEQPFADGKGSILLAGRRTYFDLLLGLIPRRNRRSANQSTFLFFDVNAKVNYELNSRNRITVTSYLGEDVLQFQDLFGTQWRNQTGTFQWTSKINHRSFLKTTLYASNFSVESEVNLVSSRFGYLINYSLRDIGGKADLEYELNAGNKLRLGVEGIYHRYFFGETLPSNPRSIVTPERLDPAFALEKAAYASIDINPIPNLHINLGLRYSMFSNYGKATVNLYDDSGILDTETVIDSINIDSWRAYFRYHGPEPRLEMHYELDSANYVKFTYDRTRQYTHQLSNTNTPSPVDMWAPVNPYIKPQIADQVALGYFYSHLNKKEKRAFEFSVEGYIKNLQNQIDFKPLASLLLNNHLETEVLAGNGLSWGTELLMKKSTEKFSASINYTLSGATRRINGINQNKRYPTSFDRRHSLVTVFSVQLSPRILFSASWNYASGIAYSFPVGKYEKDGFVVPYYTSRNGFRLPDNHHLDLSLTVFREMTKDRMNESSFTFSVYNAYLRKNTYAYVFRQSSNNSSQTQTVKLYLFSIVPSFNYNFKF
ncbi:MAG: TonB-dependent receptor [Flammeovirgaceae bacterium]